MWEHTKRVTTATARRCSKANERTVHNAPGVRLTSCAFSFVQRSYADGNVHRVTGHRRHLRQTMKHSRLAFLHFFCRRFYILPLPLQHRLLQLRHRLLQLRHRLLQLRHRLLQLRHRLLQLRHRLLLLLVLPLFCYIYCFLSLLYILSIPLISHFHQL